LPRPLFHGRCHWHTAASSRSDALPTSPVISREVPLAHGGLVAKRRPSYLARYFTGGATGTRRPRREATPFLPSQLSSRSDVLPTSPVIFTGEAASSRSDEAVR